MKKSYYGAGILIWTKDKDNNISYLLGKRSFNPSKGKWSISGGKWDKSDGLSNNTGKPNYLDTATRETKEELGYEIKNKDDVKSLWKINIPFFHFKVYSLELPEKKNFDNIQEFTEVEWFNINNIPKDSVFFIRSQISKLKHQQLK